MNDDLCFKTATELASLIRSKELSARQVMEAHLQQIERVNPAVNAIVTLLPERAMQAAGGVDSTDQGGHFEVSGKPVVRHGWW